MVQREKDPRKYRIRASRIWFNMFSSNFWAGTSGTKRFFEKLLYTVIGYIWCICGMDCDVGFFVICLCTIVPWCVLYRFWWFFYDWKGNWYVIWYNDWYKDGTKIVLLTLNHASGWNTWVTLRVPGFGIRRAPAGHAGCGWRIVKFS